MLDMAAALAQRSPCMRRQVACLITDPAVTQVLGMGYNGVEAGGPNTCGPSGTCVRMASGGGDVPATNAYEGCLHAEMNALVKAPPGPKLAYVTIWPCLTCARLMINSSVQHVYVRGSYASDAGVQLLESRGIGVTSA